MGQSIVAGAEAPGEDGEVWPPGFEQAKHMAGTSTPTQDGQATPNPSTPTKDSQRDSLTTPDPSDATPTPREAARCLARFTEGVQLKRRSPLIATPPRQKAVTRRPLPTRSRQIAARSLAHIPTSKRGEVLLMKRIANLSQATPTSSASKRAYDAIFTGNLTSGQVTALDELFPATNNRASRRATLTPARSSRITE